MLNLDGHDDRAQRAMAGARALARDALGIAGAAAVTYGAYLIAPAAGFIAGGLLLLLGAWLHALADR